MLIIPPPVMRVIIDAAEAAYPEESCGLLVGHGVRRVVVTRAVPSVNVAADPRKNFEIDPALRFRLMRDLDKNKDKIIGHFHSHPDCPALPSKTDLVAAYEPDLFWIITSVFGGQALMTTVHRLDAEAGKAVKVSFGLG